MCAKDASSPSSVQEKKLVVYNYTAEASLQIPVRFCGPNYIVTCTVNFVMSCSMFTFVYGCFHS